MGYIPIDAGEITIEIENGTDGFVEIGGIEEAEISISKDAQDIRTLGELWQKEWTSQVGGDINIGGHFVEDDDSGEMDDGLAELFEALYAGSPDDVKEFKIGFPGLEETDGDAVEADFRVMDGSENSSFAEKVDWSVTLQSHGDPNISN